jgi:hypothetical protein
MSSDLLERLRARGIHVTLEDADRLRIRGPAHELTPAIRAEIARRKPELLALLRGGPDAKPAATPPDDPATRDRDWVCEFEERAAMLEHEAGFDRAEAERRALEETRARRQRLVAPLVAHPLVQAAIEQLGAAVQSVRLPDGGNVVFAASAATADGEPPQGSRSERRAGDDWRYEFVPRETMSALRAMSAQEWREHVARALAAAPIKGDRR